MTEIAVLQYLLANMLKKSGVLLQFRSVPNKNHRIIKLILASKILIFWWFYFNKVQKTAGNTDPWLRYC